MTHSHDRTLLASMGFADPDKREPLHDLACEYLAEPEQARRLVRFTEPEEVDPVIESSLESLVQKGEGQYRTTIGFLDVRVDWEGKTRNWEGSVRNGAVIVEVKAGHVPVATVLRQIGLYREYVVPKPPKTPIDIGTRLRAIEANRLGTPNPGYVPTTRLSWILATLHDLVAGEVETLQRSGIHYLPLDRNELNKWYEERLKRLTPKTKEF